MDEKILTEEERKARYEADVKKYTDKGYPRDVAEQIVGEVALEQLVETRTEGGK